ncbi:hypothetical protein Bca4012_007384 [Brassica carinata]
MRGSRAICLHISFMSEAAILGFLQNNESISDSGQFAAEHNLDHEEVKNVIKSLQGFRYIEAKETLVLTDDGKKYAAEGSPEIHFFSAIPEEGSISKDDLEFGRHEGRLKEDAEIRDGVYY